MVNPSLSELPGIPPSYIGFLEGVPPQEGQVLPDRPEKELLLSRCKSLLSRMAPDTTVSELSGKAMPAVPGIRSMSGHIEKLARRSAVVIGTSADVADFDTSLVPLLKCLTAIKLADEISIEGLPAVPLLWLDAAARAQTDEEKSSTRIDSQDAVVRHSPTVGADLISYLNNVAEVSLNTNLNSGAIHPVLARLTREFGLVLVDSTAVRLLLSGREELEVWRRRVDSICAAEGVTQEAREKPGRGMLRSDRAIDTVLLGLSVPLAAEVIGPEDYETAVRISSLVGSVGSANPFLWPRVSATIVDRRSCKIMGKFRLRLPDLLEGVETLSERLGSARTASEVSNRLETLAGTVRSRVDEISARAARDSKAVRRIGSAGAKMLYQLRKLAVRSRQFADAHQDTAVGQLERLRRQVAPGGELQEGKLAALQFLSMYPASALQTLYRKIDIWDLKHQLILGLD